MGEADRMNHFLLVLNASHRPMAEQARKAITDLGIVVSQTYGQKVMVIEADPEGVEALATHPGVAGVFGGRVPDLHLDQLDETGQLGIAAWNERQTPSYRTAKAHR